MDASKKKQFLKNQRKKYKQMDVSHKKRTIAEYKKKGIIAWIVRRKKHLNTKEINNYK